MIDDLPALSILAVPVVAGAIAMEWWAISTGRARGRYNPRHAFTSVLMGIGNITINSATALFSLWILKYICQHHVWDMPDTWLFFPVVMLVYDFFYYWKHRLAHRVRWFWTQHVSHHTGEIMNMSTAARQSILNGIVGTWMFYVPAVLAGFTPELMLGLLGANLAFQWFVHTESVPRLHPWVEWWINTPSNHRVHHGRNVIDGVAGHGQTIPRIGVK